MQDPYPPPPSPSTPNLRTASRGTGQDRSAIAACKRKRRWRRAGPLIPPRRALSLWADRRGTQARAKEGRPHTTRRTRTPLRCRQAPQRLGQGLAAEEMARLHTACRQVRLGEASHTRQMLTAANLAPGDAETFRQLVDADACPEKPSERIPREVLDYVPEEPLQPDERLFQNRLRGKPRGLSGGLSSMKNEHLKLLLHDEEALTLLTGAARQLATGILAPEIARALAMSRITASQKSGEQRRVRGIAVGDMFRRASLRSSTPKTESAWLTRNVPSIITPKLPDLQCAWLLLYHCAPRANSMVRNVPARTVHEVCRPA